MKIIRDNELGGFGMIPLFVQWGIKRCNVEGCTNLPTTIVTGLGEGILIAGFCEDHFQEAKKPDGARFDLCFDYFDAWSEQCRNCEYKHVCAEDDVQADCCPKRKLAKESKSGD